MNFNLDFLRRSRESLLDVIESIKAQIEPGTEYINTVVRAVVSCRGAYYQFLEEPREFFGGLGKVEIQNIDSEETIRLLEQIYQMTNQINSGNCQVLDILVVYDPGIDSSENVYVFRFQSKAGKGQIQSAGFYRSQTLPLFFEVKVDSKLAQPILGGISVICFFIALADQHLLVKAVTNPGTIQLDKLTSPDLKTH